MSPMTSPSPSSNGVIQCVERVAAEGHVAGDWERRLAWLNDALAEAWSGRGTVPRRRQCPAVPPDSRRARRSSGPY